MCSTPTDILRYFRLREECPSTYSICGSRATCTYNALLSPIFAMLAKELFEPRVYQVSPHNL
jgi:hypothetical protein